ncbi:TetR/AcrR family transcriptional regulator [Dermatobacter hominis]|uniref:TetR/AcrR family transcriptional regulator n=1 Tax=Dermatobacter hominis TaxID=2884263 RepID=UPI001D113FA9|nr:TetR/AcrR family transcriptional regulator [Dermatobacter hominis]UDY36657.1 TetR/AcrR family transcriptional regulator [Dermatobacter hominis]
MATDEDGDDPIAVRAARYSTAQRRTADVALDLFAAHGVAGTSLQMIADDLGVTKAAVYHQFRSKESIVVAVLDVRLLPLADAVDRAEAAGGTPSARRELLTAILRAVVADRAAWRALQSDPVLLRTLGEHGPSRDLWSRLFRLLVGDDREPADRVRAAVLSAAIGAVSHPFVADLPDDELAADLLPILSELAGTAPPHRGRRTAPPDPPDR